MATKHTIKEQARDKLLTAYNEAILRNITDCPHKDLIDYVIDGTHLTFNIDAVTTAIKQNIKR